MTSYVKLNKLQWPTSTYCSTLTNHGVFLTRVVWDLVSHGNILLLNGIDYYVYIVNTVLYITHSDYLKWWNNCI